CAEGRFGNKTRRGPARKGPPAATPRLAAAHPNLRAGVIDDNIHPASFRENLDLHIEFIGLVIDQKIGAQLFPSVELLLHDGAYDHAASYHLRDLDGCRADTRARAEYQHIFARPYVSLADQHAPCREKDEWRRRSLLE